MRAGYPKTGIFRVKDDYGLVKIVAAFNDYTIENNDYACESGLTTGARLLDYKNNNTSFVVMNSMGGKLQKSGQPASEPGIGRTATGRASKFVQVAQKMGVKTPGKLEGDVAYDVRGPGHAVLHCVQKCWSFCILP